MTKIAYPLRFVPEAKERVWGGNRLAKDFNKPFDGSERIGESWEITGFEQDSSVIQGGWLDGNPLFDVMETYMDEIVGEDNYKRFGNEFPILVKLLDINDRLSVQVHPDDETAFDRHNSYGKNEAWYVMDAEPDAKIYMGFNRDLTVDEFLSRCAAGTLEEVLNVITPRKGDFFFIEAGTVHSAGGGVVIAEIQQLSDVTYRIYDWGREHNPATARQMHLDLAISCIDFRKYTGANYVPAGIDRGARKRLVSNKYFTANEISLTGQLKLSPEERGSFVLCCVLQGKAQLNTPAGQDTPADSQVLQAGEWTLLPAVLTEAVLTPLDADVRLMEVYIGDEC